MSECNDYKFYPETETDFQYSLNGGFIFDNTHTVRKVKDVFYMGSTSDQIERRLFKVFASPEVEYVEALPKYVVKILFKHLTQS